MAIKSCIERSHVCVSTALLMKLLNQPLCHKLARSLCLIGPVLTGVTPSDTFTVDMGSTCLSQNREFKGLGSRKIIGQQADRLELNQAKFIQVANRQIRTRQLVSLLRPKEHGQGQPVC